MSPTLQNALRHLANFPHRCHHFFFSSVANPTQRASICDTSLQRRHTVHRFILIWLFPPRFSFRRLRRVTFLSPEIDTAGFSFRSPLDIIKKYVLLRQPAMAGFCKSGFMGAADAACSIRYVGFVEERMGFMLNKSPGASSVVPREDSGAFSSQLEGT